MGVLEGSGFCLPVKEWEPWLSVCLSVAVHLVFDCPVRMHCLSGPRRVAAANCSYVMLPEIRRTCDD